MKKTEISIDFNLVLGRIIQRLNRFMVLVEINDGVSYAHLPNSGRLPTALSLGDLAFLRKYDGLSLIHI